MSMIKKTYHNLNMPNTSSNFVSNKCKKSKKTEIKKTGLLAEEISFFEMRRSKKIMNKKKIKGW